jgi:peptidoglycan lytic transglycosylase
MTRRRLCGSFVLVVLALATVGCATARRTSVPGSAGPEPGTRIDGMASWYGQQHQGRPTASGEAYDMNKLTAAHRTLPFGTRLRVTNIENGKSVVVRVNDRGPHVPGRVLDLSYRAAQALGMTDAGMARVEVVVLRGRD